MNRATAALLTALSLALAGCSSAAGPHPTRSCTDEADRFAFDAPIGWKFYNDERCKAFVFSPKDDHGYRPSVTVVVVPAGGVASAAECVKKNREQLPATCEGYKEIKALAAPHASGREACLMEYEFTPQPSADQKDWDPEFQNVQGQWLHSKSWTLLSNGKQYTITASWPAVSTENWPARMDPVLDSFIVW